MSASTVREAVFISHATPEDNDFVRWLGAKLNAMGYEVWADVLRLHGGIDWARALEDALRNRAAKVLVVCTPVGLEKQGVRNEIEIATGIATSLSDKAFVIPLRMEPYAAPFRIAHLQYIDFANGWSSGLAELSDLLTAQAVPKRSVTPTAAWLKAQSHGAAVLSDKSEPLISNWLELATMPARIHYVSPPVGSSRERFQDRLFHHWPVVPHMNGAFTFATPDVDGVLRGGIPAKLDRSMNCDEFLDNGIKELGVAGEQGRKIFVDLVTQGFDLMCSNLGLKAFVGANKRASWWPDIKLAPFGQVRFDWNTRRGARQIIGHSNKRGVHWHYAVAGQFRLGPVRHLRLSPRLVFSENGFDAIEEVRRAHTLRRSFAKGWRNARWRDMLSAYIWWLSKKTKALIVPVGDTETFSFDVPPMQFGCPVSVADVDDAHALEEVDDPDVELTEDDEQSDSEDEA